MRHSFLGYLIYQELFLKSALAELEALEEVAPPEESIYRYPGKLSTEEMMQLNVEYFERFVRINYQQARVFNAHYAHFLQPIRWIGKELTPREKSYQQSVTPQRYRSYVRAVEAMQGDVPSFSLTEAFQDISTTVYMDHIHPNHEGLTRLAQIIARTTAEQWFNTKTP